MIARLARAQLWALRAGLLDWPGQRRFDALTSLADERTRAYGGGVR